MQALAFLAAVVASFLLVSPASAVVHAGNEDRTISKVVKLLQDLLDRSKADGSAERELYAKYKCYVDTNTKEKTELVDDLTADIGLYKGKIEALQGSSGALSSQVAQLSADIAENEQARAEAVALRAKEKVAYDAEVADLTSAISQMSLAIQTLADIGSDQTLQTAADHSKFMAGYGSKSALLKLSSSMKQALIAAKTFMGPSQEAKVESFLAEEARRAPFTGTYSSQSGEVVGILKQMRDTFASNINVSMATEAAAVKAHDSLMATKLEEIAVMTASYDAKQASLGTNDGDLATLKVQLTQATDEKASAEAFLAILEKGSAAKAAEWDQRNMLRTNEEAAIAQAIAVLNSDQAFHTFGKVTATTTGATGSFLQLRAVRRHLVKATNVKVNSSAALGAASRKQVEGSLRSCAASHSQKLRRVLALLQAGNPFDIVLAEITKMQTLITKEAKVDQMQLDWCSAERKANNAEVVNKGAQIDALNSEIQDITISINDPDTGLHKNIESTEDSIQANAESQKQETESRRTEAKLYSTDIGHISEAESLLGKAIYILKKYYNAIEIEQEKELGFVQQKEDPSPPTTWKGPFGGQSAQATNAVGMLEFILQETTKEGIMAHETESASQKDYEDSMKTLTDQEEDLGEALVNFKKLLADAQLDLERKYEALHVTTREKVAVERYLESIKPGCDFITMNFATREANLAEESAALTKAVELIQSSPAYKAAMSAAGIAALGSCAPLCAGGNRTMVSCEACLAGVSEPAYCAGHKGTPGC